MYFAFSVYFFVHSLMCKNLRMVKNFILIEMESLCVREPYLYTTVVSYSFLTTQTFMKRVKKKVDNYRSIRIPKKICIRAPSNNFFLFSFLRSLLLLLFLLDAVR